MVYTPKYTDLVSVRLITDFSAKAISNDDGYELMKLGEKRVDSLIQQENIDSSGWGGTVPDLVKDCATFYCAAEWVRKMRAKFAGVEGGTAYSIVRDFEQRAMVAWNDYLKELNVTSGQRILITLKPITANFDEKEWRKLED